MHVAYVQSDDPNVMFRQEYDLAGPEDYTHREVNVVAAPACTLISVEVQNPLF